MSATREDLDAALAAGAIVIQTAFADLEAKIAAGTVTTPEDFSAEIATLKDIVSGATAADPGPTTPPVTT